MNKFRNKNIIIVAFLIVLIGVFAIGYFFYQNKQSEFEKIANETEKQFPVAQQLEKGTEVIAENLDTPWGMVFLPDRSILITERLGRVRLVNSDGSLQQTPVATMNTVKEIGEGGLLGIALHPNFPSNHGVYLYYTYESSGNQTLNRVVRMKYKDGKLEEEQVIVDKIPGAPNHNGGRIKFGPDHLLYITTGDAQEPSQAQDRNTLGGKILRVTDSGEPAPGNPFNNLVYSYGHRNPQGLAWDDKGRLWATEHGRSGVLSGLDELNLIESGKNYGWPTIQGDETRVGMETPRLHSGSATWAPAGMAFVGKSLFFGGLRGQALYEITLKGNQPVSREHLKGEFGRIRDVVGEPDGMLYITTSNHGGRGTPKEGDDKILRINIQNLEER